MRPKLISHSPEAFLGFSFFGRYFLALTEAVVVWAGGGALGCVSSGLGADVGSLGGVTSFF